MGTFETALLAELRLGLPPLFYYRIVEIKDDWGFVLKLHSFFEGPVTAVIEDKLHTRKNVRETLIPRDSFVSRVYLADRLKLLEPDFKNFLLELNRLRNDITHNIRYIDFSLRRYVDNLSDAQFRKTAACLGAGFKNLPFAKCPEFASAFPRIGKDRHINTVREFFWKLSPRACLWNSGVWTLDLLSLHWHFEEEAGSIRKDTELEAKLQDLLLDPAVLGYRRKLQKRFPEHGSPGGG